MKRSRVTKMTHHLFMEFNKIPVCGRIEICGGGSICGIQNMGLEDSHFVSNGSRLTI